MKRFFHILFFSAICFQITTGQTTVIQGKPISEIFTDFHYNIDDSTKTSGFGINRAYFGYNYLPGGNFSATMILNIGTPEDLSAGAAHRRYAFFREASLAYTKDNLIITFGITGTRLFDFQQRFWGKRYIASSYQSLNGYGFVADLGLVVDYKISDVFKAEFTLMNGEGYSDLQLDNSLRTSAGLIITPVKEWAVKVYGDAENIKGQMRYTMVGFAGFKNDNITIGGEASFKTKLDLKDGHNVWGLSGTGAIRISKKMEVFSRYDYSTSAKLPEDNLHWNYLKDGTFFVFGLQRTFTQNVQIALDYQGTNPSNPDTGPTDMIFINAHFKF